METSTTSADYTVTFDEDESLIDMQPSGKTTTNFYPFTLKNGTAYTLAVQTDYSRQQRYCCLYFRMSS